MHKCTIIIICVFLCIATLKDYAYHHTEKFLRVRKNGRACKRDTQDPCSKKNTGQTASEQLKRFREFLKTKRT